MDNAAHWSDRAEQHSDRLPYLVWGHNPIGRCDQIGVAAYSRRTKAGKWHSAMADNHSSDHPLAYLLFAILGWLNASWRGIPVTFFGVFELPKLLGTRVPGWAWTGDIHSLLADYVLLALVGLHVAAALYHYFVHRDGVLQRMLPRRLL